MNKNNKKNVLLTDNIHVSCIGNEGSEHPKVWYDLSNKESVSCGYCNKEFKKKK